MFEALRKKSLKSTLALSIIMIVIGAAMVLFQGVTAFYGLFGYVDFKTLKPEQIRNQMVDIEMVTNFGSFIEEYEYNKDTHFRRTTDLYYVIWTGDDYDVSDTEFRYMGIKVPVSYQDELDDMAEAYWEGSYSAPVSFSGRIRKMNDEEYQYFKEYFTSGEDGASTEWFEENTLPYYIQTVPSKAGTNGTAFTVTGGGLLLIVWAVIRICRAASGATLKSLRNTLAAEGCTDASAESDYNSAQTFAKNCSIRVGLRFIYYMSGAAPKAIPASKILWAYQNTTTHYRNGIKTGTSYSVMIYTEGGEKSSYTLSVPNENVSQSILQRISVSFPWAVVGYSDELKRMFNKDRSQFLALRYNTVAHVAIDPVMANTNQPDLQ